MRKPLALAMALAMALLFAVSPLSMADTDVPADARVTIETTEGTFVIALEGRRAPLTVGNFLKLVDSGYYDGTVFHRVIPNFMIQGGGFNRDLEEMEPTDAIVNESGNGLRNLRGSVVMARLGDPHTAVAQFFINVTDNRSLDPKPDRWGFAVFGYVIEGMNVVDKISKSRAGPGGRFAQDVPVVPVIITRASRTAISP